jgi:phosphoglycerate dehydrogenase-like enzyme
MPKILIAESLDMEAMQSFQGKQGVYVHTKNPIPDNIPENEIHFYYRPDFLEEEIKKEIHIYEGLVVRPREVPATVMQAGKRLKLIVRGGSGMNAIDLNVAKALNIAVENTPGENSVSTAEFTFALIMQIVANRQIDISSSDVRNGRPKEVKYYQGQELEGKKLAIIGMGNIGMHVAKRAVAFDMEVSYFNRSDKNVPYKKYDTIHSLLADGHDIVSLHVPLTTETNKFFGEKEFSLMKKGSVLINSARPQLVDPTAFADALLLGILSSAGIDGDMDLIEPFVKADIDRKCIITNHIADSTKQAKEKITRAVFNQIIEYFYNRKLIN